jgi:hypothetical protein
MIDKVVYGHVCLREEIRRSRIDKVVYGHVCLREEILKFELKKMSYLVTVNCNNK